MKFSRFLGLAVLCLCLNSNGASAQTDSATQSALLITVTPVSSSVILGKPALVKISLTNMSKQTVTLEVFAPHPAYHLFDFSLTAHGQNVQETPLHRSVKNRQRVEDPPADLSLRSILVDIQPGTTRVYEANLADLFGLEEATSYNLVVSMTDPVSGARIVAPEVSISVVK
jgi:hypothetical protein